VTSVRSEGPQDIAAIREILLASFPSDAEARLVELLRDAGHLAVALVAEIDGRVVGHAAFSSVSTAAGAPGVGLAPIAVMPAQRCHGVGRELVERGLAACTSLGFGWAVVLGEPAYYSRFGFVLAADSGLVDEYGGGRAFQVIELIPGSLPVGAGLVRYAPEFGSVA
jgi:putative acetyltransferase